jgi:hypothetical protein
MIGKPLLASRTRRFLSAGPMATSLLSTSLDRSLAIAIIRREPGLWSWRGFRAAGHSPAAAFRAIPVGRVAAAVSDRDLRSQSPRYELLRRTPVPPGDQDGPDRPLMDETATR